MSIPAAYAAVVIVWSTTPLGVVWSSETVPPVLAAALRMALAAFVGLAIMKWRGIPLPFTKAAMRVYASSVLGVFGAMFCTYLAARSVSSGMISIIFGLSPLISGLLAQLILGDQSFSKIRWLATLIAVSGLYIICADDMTGQQVQTGGMILILLAVLLFSLSGVLVKQHGRDLHPFATTVGTLFLSLPLYAISAVLLDTPLNMGDWSSKSVTAILYLAIFGSILGFVSYFYVLQKLAPSTVALITLMTPVFAIFLGAALNHETIHASLIIGAGFVMLGLGIYYWGDLLMHRLSKASG